MRNRRDPTRCSRERDRVGVPACAGMVMDRPGRMQLAKKVAVTEANSLTAAYTGIY